MSEPEPEPEAFDAHKRAISEMFDEVEWFLYEAVGGTVTVKSPNFLAEALPLSELPSSIVIDAMATTSYADRLSRGREMLKLAIGDDVKSRELDDLSYGELLTVIEQWTKESGM